jgi:HEAT repeat protein
VTRRAVTVAAVALLAVAGAGLAGARLAGTDAARVRRAADEWTLAASGDVERRRAAAEALLARADPESAPALERACDDPDIRVRAAALHALGALGLERSRPAVRARLRAATEPFELRHAAWAAGCLRDRESSPRLIELTAPLPPTRAALPDWERARLQAIGALGLAGGDGALPALVSAAADPAEKVRVLAAVAIGSLDTPEAARALVDLLEREPADRVHGAIIGSLRQIAADEAGAPAGGDPAEWRRYLERAGATERAAER